MRSIPRFHLLVFIIALLSVPLVSLEKFADDPGVGWHLKTGEWIREHRTVPHVDPFTSPENARPWISDQWLSDLILSSLYSVGDFQLVYAVLVALSLITFFIVIASALKRSGLSYIATTIAVLFSFKIAQVHLILRPVVFGIFCFALLFAMFLPFYRQEQQIYASDQLKQYSKKLLVLVPLLFLCWANLHPSFSLGLVFIALLLIGSLLDQFFFPDVYQLEQLRLRRSILLCLFMLAFLASIVNPYGIKLHESILELGSSTFFMNYHQEWNSPDFSATEGQLFLIMLGAAFLSFFVQRAKNLKPTLVDFLVICFFTHASLDAVRFLPFFGIVIAPYVARSLSIFSQLKDYPGQALLEQAWERINHRESFGFPGRPVIYVLLACFVGASIWSHEVPLYKGEYGPSQKNYPYQELDALDCDSQKTIAAEAMYGGFISWKGNGKCRALIDDRNGLFGEQYYKDFDRALAGKDGWREYFKNLGATHLLLQKDSDLERELKKNKSLPLLFEGNVASVFLLN